MNLTKFMASCGRAFHGLLEATCYDIFRPMLHQKELLVLFSEEALSIWKIKSRESAAIVFASNWLGFSCCVAEPRPVKSTFNIT